MEKLQIEWEIFCEITNRKTYILWVPTLWMLFCLAMMIGLDQRTKNLLSHPAPSAVLPLYEFAYNFAQMRIVYIAGFTLITAFYLTYILYKKQRDRLY